MCEMKVCLNCKIEKALSCYDGEKNNIKKLNQTCRDCLFLYKTNKLLILENKQICTKCFIKQSLGDFGQYKKNSTGYHFHCKKCRKIAAKERYIKNKEYYDQKNKDWKKNNKERYNELSRNRAKIRQKNDPQYRIRHNLRSRINKVLEGEIKSNKTMELLGCTIEFLKEYIEKQFTDGMTWGNYGLYGWHIDHIKQCFTFDLTDPEQQKICFHYTNLRPLWAKDNLSRPCFKT